MSEYDEGVGVPIREKGKMIRAWKIPMHVETKCSCVVVIVVFFFHWFLRWGIFFGTWIFSSMAVSFHWQNISLQIKAKALEGPPMSICSIGSWARVSNATSGRYESSQSNYFVAMLCGVFHPVKWSVFRKITYVSPILSTPSVMCNEKSRCVGWDGQPVSIACPLTTLDTSFDFEDGLMIRYYSS